KPGLVQRGDMLDTSDVLDILAIDLIGIVPEDETVLISTNRGNPAAFDEKSRAGLAFRNIARRITGEDVPFQTFREETGLFGRFSRLLRRDGRTA
ncbi:MAG TPA: septum site-determining protein MinD, partial [Anaerolineae bacterium]